MIRKYPSSYVPRVFLLCLFSLLWAFSIVVAGEQIKVTMILWDGSTQNEEGFQEGLREAGYNVNFTIFDAKRETQNLDNILQDPQSFAQTQLLYVSTATVLKAVLSKIRNIPIVFRIDSHAATHDVGLILKQQYPQITGICNNVQFAIQYQAIKQLLPLRRLGFLYNPSNDDAIAEGQYLRQFVTQGQFTMVDVQVSTPEKIPAALDTLVKAGVDILYLPPDPFVLRYSKTIVQGATQRRIPTFTGIERLVLESGALFALAGNNLALGKLAAQQADRILKGESPADIPLVHSMNFAPVINLDTAKALQIVIPVSLLLAAKKVKATHIQ